MPMLPTELQRIVLLIGLAATAYLMILAWNDDYVQGAPPVDYAPAPETGDPSVGVDAEEVGQPPPDSDVPDSTLIPPVAGAPAAGAGTQSVPVVPDSPSDRLVTVSTPKLKIWIDLLGGDVVRVELPTYPFDIERPDVAYLLLDNGGGRTYIAQSGLIGQDGIDSLAQRPRYRTTSSSYSIDDPDDTLSVVLETDVEGLRVQKRFSFLGDQHLVTVQYRVENRRAEAIQASLFAQIKRDAKEPVGDSTFRMGMQPYVGAALTTSENRYEKLEFEDLDEGTFRTVEQGGWMAFLQHYFLSAWVADPEQTHNYYGRSRADGTYIFGFTGPLTTVAPGREGVWTAQLYAGPKAQKRLEQISPNLNLTVDYGFLWWLAVPLFHVLDWLHDLCGNWGVAIILLTLMVKLILYPLSAASYRSMANMRRVAPQMKRLQERHADDRQKLSQEMMALYKKEKVNPLGGCLPMLLPMPIFIALYWVLFESVELRHAPFALWITDLSTMDPFFVLPLLMGGSMYLMQLMTPMMGDPMQQKMMRLMPVMFTALFLFFPAGLALYMLVNNLFSMAQQWYNIRQSEKAQAAKG